MTARPPLARDPARPLPTAVHRCASYRYRRCATCRIARPARVFRCGRGRYWRDCATCRTGARGAA